MSSNVLCPAPGRPALHPIGYTVRAHNRYYDMGLDDLLTSYTLACREKKYDIRDDVIVYPSDVRTFFLSRVVRGRNVTPPSAMPTR